MLNSLQVSVVVKQVIYAGIGKCVCVWNLMLVACQGGVLKNANAAANAAVSNDDMSMNCGNLCKY